MSDDEEPIVCDECGETPELFWNPYSDKPYRLRCGCEISSADVTECLESNKLMETMSGKWSNLDFDSKVRENT